MTISAQLVKTLREQTGAGMMDCKRALVDTSGDMEAAIQLLRKKGLSSASKKSDRVAAEGLVCIAISDDKKKASIVEVNSETDFVARNEQFLSLVKGVANYSLENSDIESVRLKYQEEVNMLISVVGENMVIRRSESLTSVNGIVTTYIHGMVKDSMGKIGVLVSIDSDDASCIDHHHHSAIHDFGKKIAMHIAAMKPKYLSVSDVPSSLIESEKAIIIERAKEMGKPDGVASKMAESRISGLYDEIVLLEQVFAIDQKTKIKDVVAGFNKEHNCKVHISSFVMYVLGEGIEKVETNFAEEVGSLLK